MNIYNEVEEIKHLKILLLNSADNDTLSLLKSTNKLQRNCSIRDIGKVNYFSMHEIRIFYVRFYRYNFYSLKTVFGFGTYWIFSHRKRFCSFLRCLYVYFHSVDRNGTSWNWLELKAAIKMFYKFLIRGHIQLLRTLGHFWFSSF